MPRKKKVEEVSGIKIGDIIKIDDDMKLLVSDKYIGAPVCQKLRKGAEIKIIGISVDWYLVKYNTVCGYIPKSLIS